MATMLGFVTTDAAVPQPLLDRALREVVDDTFNAITVDGECSTNDCVMLLANGASGAVVDEETYGAFVAGPARRLSAARARHRPRRRRGHQAGHGDRHRRRNRRRRAARSQGDRQLAAGQDGDSRRRSELGPSHRGGRPRRRRLRSVARRGHDWRYRALSERTAARRGSGAGGRVPEIPGSRRDRRPRRRHGIVDGVDVRL